MDTYEGDFQRMLDTYLEFLHNLPFYGLAVLCGDDPVIQSLIPEIGRKYLTYGFSEQVDVRAVNLESGFNSSQFTVLRDNKPALDIRLNIGGKHNVLNALAAIAVATDEGIEDSAIHDALAAFEGIGRRFEHLGEFDTGQGNVTLVDDYGHHPTEVAATIAVARENWPDRRLVMAYQPHRFTRTRDLYEDFVKVLSQVDVLLLLEVYSAGETPIEGADSKALCRSIRLRGQIEPIYVANKEELPQVMADCLREGDVLMTQGAGNIGQIAKQLQGAQIEFSAINRGIRRMTEATLTARYGKVAVMFGGLSAEREVSLSSGQAVLNALQQAGVDAFAFDPAERPLSDLLTESVQRVVIMLHGRGGEDGSLQGALQQLNLPYSGSGVLGSALAMDKVRSKQIWQSLELPTAKYEIAVKSRFDAGSCEAIMAKLGGKVMVKPSLEGSSIGMTKVTESAQLHAAVQDAFKYDNTVLLRAVYSRSRIHGEYSQRRSFAVYPYVHSPRFL